MKNLSGKTKFNTAYFFIAMMAVLLIQDIWQATSTTARIPYSDFQKHLKENNIKEVMIGEKNIRGTLLKPGENKANFITNRVDSDLVEQLSKYDVKYTQMIENTFFRDLLSWILPVFIFFGLWVFLLKRMGKNMGGGFMSVGKSKAKIYVETDTKTTFKDVAGVDEAKQELKEIIEFLKNQERYSKLGGRMPKGVLLVGPPGTGKTLLAKAVAGEAAVPFFSISGSEFVEMFVGVGAARVRDLFEQARKQAPCIIFIDELDALGRARGVGPMSGGHDEKEQTLNQLLTELDGFDSKEGIVLLGATNRPEVLDQALLRAGRFDRQVLVDRPDKIGRLQILNVHVKKITLSEKTDLEKVAAITAGFTGADLANLVNEAALVATRRNGDAVEDDDFNVAVERIIAGLERKNRLLNEFERKVVAHHEMGHALVAASLKGCDPVHKVSIIPRGIGALGYTIQRPTEDRFLMKKEELENKMAVLMGGRAAEKLIFEHLSTGASDDLNRATDIARSMVMKYGMNDALGPVTYDKESNYFLGGPSYSPRTFSEETAREIDIAVKGITSNAFEYAYNLLNTNKDLLLESAEKLLDQETLVEEDLQPIFDRLSV
ncbi:MAG: ATP-dependent metallopeptidase FtsH/Yme1/Tma family protein [Deltaproteobacteria bacterium]|nr:MAG: ATP-dependent metallopeptidase FtsH/Yme1/Tma family protein [Deltaproteobacteria bacterium]